VSTVRCWSCQAEVGVAGKAAGETINCPGCGQPVRVPAEAAKAGKAKRAPGEHPLGRGGDFLTGAVAFLTPARLGLVSAVLLVTGALLPVWSPPRPRPEAAAKEGGRERRKEKDGKEPEKEKNLTPWDFRERALAPFVLAAAAVVLVFGLLRFSPGLLATGAGTAAFTLAYLIQFLQWRDAMRVQLREAEAQGFGSGLDPSTLAVLPQGWLLLFLGAGCAALAGWRARRPD
jgi:hypothetical protein